MEIHRKTFKHLIDRVPRIVKDITGMDTLVQYPTHLTREECMLRGLTYATNINATNGTCIVQLPYMGEDGTFIVKGQKR